MKKTPTLFIRDAVTHRIVDIWNEEAFWVRDGEGIPTRKWDGTCCLIKDGQLFKRYDGSKKKYLPPDFVPAEGPAVGKESHWVGWRPVGLGPEDRWFNEAWTPEAKMLPNGTYELIGPKINGGPEHCGTHRFRKHGDIVVLDAPRTFNELKAWLDGRDVEGIVFHHPDGRMAKIKGKDFGLKRPIEANEHTITRNKT